MIRAFLIFLLLTIAVAGGITSFRALSGKEKWQLTKTLGFALLCSAVTLFLLFFIVILF